MSLKDDTARVDWVDCSKGLCILMVVMMHSTLGVEAAVGSESWMHAAVAFAKPFRMPDFFLIAGLFLSRRIDRDWPDYIDRKVIHFAYFYILWLAIQLALRLPAALPEISMAGAVATFAHALVQPFGTLWFIYLLPIFFVVTKALRKASAGVVFTVAAVLEISDIHTGSVIIDEFAARFVYFYSGYIFAPHILGAAERVGRQPLAALAALTAWAVFNAFCVSYGWADRPLVSLALGFAGVGAVLAMSVLVAEHRAARPLAYCGEHSIVIYLAFTIPMAATRILLLKTGWITDTGAISLVVTAAGVLGSLIIYWSVRNTALAFLFKRPDWAHLARRTPVEKEPRLHA